MWSLIVEPGWAVDEDRRRGEDPVADAADLDDERVERDRPDAALDGGDHPVRASRFSRFSRASASRTARS